MFYTKPPESSVWSDDDTVIDIGVSSSRERIGDVMSSLASLDDFP